MSLPVTFHHVAEAAERIRDAVHRTPVFTAASLDQLLDGQLYFKCENLQRTGAFKFRGATNAVRSLTDDVARRGVATHSSGNHGAALARAAAERGIPCHVVMPDDSRAVKRAAVEAYGGRVIDCPPTHQGRRVTAARVIAETGATLVHPYEDPRVVAGQGTAALELLEEVPDLDVVVAPLGGGGLLAGTAIACNAMAPAAEVIGVEPAGADDAARSLAAGHIVEVTPRTVADGLRATLGELPFTILRHFRVRVETVGDDATLAAMALAWQRLKLVVEPSAAVAFAALMEGLVDCAGKRVGVILSGGNCEPGVLA